MKSRGKIFNHTNREISLKQKTKQKNNADTFSENISVKISLSIKYGKLNAD